MRRTFERIRREQAERSSGATPPAALPCMSARMQRAEKRLRTSRVLHRKLARLGLQVKALTTWLALATERRAAVRHRR